MKKLVLAVALTLSTLAAGSAQASTLTQTFGDTVIHWNTYASPDAGDNTTEVIGGPILTGGSVVFNNDPLNTGTLNKVTIDFNTSPLGSLFSSITLGDLFLDLDADNDWDYIVDVSGAKLNGTYSILSGSVAVEGNLGAYRNSDTYGFGSGVNYRNRHPVELKETSGTTDMTGLTDTGKDATVSGWAANTTGVLTFDLNALGLNVQSFDDLAVGFTINCANDVILEKVDIPGTFVAPVPVPAAVWLLGSGLLGLAGLRRRA